MIKIQIKSVLGSVLFEYENENNTIKQTVEQAIKSGANLSRADLSEADLSGANLSRANLSGADLSEADLSGAELYGANLSGANLSRANLSRANLSRADLYRANLYRAHLYRADLSRAENAELIIAQTRILPEGDLIGYKKCIEGIVKLLIPKEAKRSSAFGRKCRAEYAEVLELPDDQTICHSLHDKKFTYRKGEIVRPEKPFEENWMEECASGIHFYITRLEAEHN